MGCRCILIALLAAACSPLVADAQQRTPAEVAERAEQTRAALNMAWTLLTGFLILFMQAGFALVETGMTRARNVAHTMAMNFMVYGLGMCGYFFVGFGLMYGGYAPAALEAGIFGVEATAQFRVTLLGHEFGLWGTQPFLLFGSCGSGILTLFLFQMAFLDTAATVPTGALAERWKFLSFALYVLAVSALIYPIYGHWVWGGGWLARLGVDFGLGHGHVDFAGSSVVHMTGGALALVGARLLGPRLGKYNADGSVNALPAHSVPMYMLGTFILAFGWFGFNAGSTPAATELNMGRIAANTMLAGAAGSVAAMLTAWLALGKPDPSFLCNGLLAGLVAITAGCAFVTPVAAVFIGAAAGVLVLGSCFFWERVARVDDPVGAISVHGVCGMWGVLAVGLFADGTYGTQGWNGVHVAREPAGVTGLLYGDPGQLGAQCIGLAANLAFVLPAGWLMFRLLDLGVGNRVSAAVEIQGLDVSDMGVLGYIDEDPKIPEGHLTSPGQEPRPARVPPDRHRRFTIRVEGIAPERLAAVWSELCRPDHDPASEFLTIYRQFTLLEGNRFRFLGGNPGDLQRLLTKVFQEALGDKLPIRTEVEPAAERTPLWS